MLFDLMKINFISVGKDNDSYINSGILHFTQRISHYYKVDWRIIPPPKNSASLSAGVLKKKEAEALLPGLEKNDYVVLLDETGQQLTSEKLAALIRLRTNDGIKRLVFIIGGAYGVDEEVKKRADFTWSLSSLTFPHQLVRLILAEQVYRACTIIKNEKYHHA